MLSRLFALWLVTLIVLPFTAPFATYETAASQCDSLVSALDDTPTVEALPARAGDRLKAPVSTARVPVGLSLPVARERVSRATSSTLFVSALLSTPLRI